MSCSADRLLQLQALIDGELDAAHTLEVETHARECPPCARELARMEALRSGLRSPGARHPAPERLRTKILESLDGSRVPAESFAPKGRGGRGFSVGVLAGGAITALAAGLAFVFLVPQGLTPEVQEQLVASHVRSLLADHLTDVATSNQHVVKPWFNGRINFALPVVDLAEQGFPLVGGRLDYIDGSVVPALVYRRDLHTINLFVRPAPGSSSLRIRTHRGFVLVSWTEGELEFLAVSDLRSEEMQVFQREFAARAAK